MSPETFTPGEHEGMAGFRRYRFAADTAIVITDTSVFVGWKQVTEDFLNLGYDVNRNTLSRTYVNISGDWDNPGSSLIPGTVMIRAVFGREIITGGEEIPGEKEEVEIYPNPASDRLFIRTGDFRPVRLRMVDLQGRVLLEKSGATDELDVTSLPAGLYFLQLGDGNGRLVTRKVVIHH